MGKGESRLGSQNHTYRKKVEEATNRLNMVKITDIKEIAGELMHGDKVEVNTMYVMYPPAWKSGKVLDD